jgi:23S rRNA (uridine2552-2'-O)-methyltransferase
MAKSPSSGRWTREHSDDIYVKRREREGLRARSAYKLAEIDARDRLLGPGLRVVDLGAAPGGWSQIAARAVAPGGRVVACDLLAIEPIPGVTVIRGDFSTPAVMTAVEAACDGRVDLVMSDMSPNISGVKAVDQARALALAELALGFAQRCLRKDGTLLVKLFQGAELQAYVAALRRRFGQVHLRKPQASRARSTEIYGLARGYGINAGNETGAEERGSRR